MQLHVAEFDSPLGTLVLAGRDGRVCALEFADHRMRMQEIFAARFGAVRLAAGANAADRHVAEEVGARLADYFGGRIDALDALPVDPGGTEFQRQVWAELRRIPAGSTCSYADLATRIGNPNAVRAVGMANSKNPIAIVVPCHRVVGADGSLTGYAGGIDRKRWLLNHEFEWSRAATS